MIEKAVRQAVRLASRISDRSSTIRFWKIRRRKGGAIQSRGREGTFIKALSVLTTASRTLAIVCRKNGNRVDASVVSGNLPKRSDVGSYRSENQNTYEIVSFASIVITWSYVTSLPNFKIIREGK